MRPTTAWLLIFLLLLRVSRRHARARPAERRRDARFWSRSRSTVVNVDVRATDSSDSPVTGLGKGDFELLEDGKPVTITNFEAVSATASPDRSLPRRRQRTVRRRRPRPGHRRTVAPRGAAAPLRDLHRQLQPPGDAPGTDHETGCASSSRSSSPPPTG